VVIIIIIIIVPQLLYPQKRRPGPTEKETGWVPEKVWVIQRRKGSPLALLGFEAWTMQPLY
jgi:hypothetical protein